MRGIVIVDKPAGWTSFDVVAKLRGVLGTKKLGHSGTLDPMATGVLPVFAGAASKAVDLQTDHDKTYLATLRLGLRTDTGDSTGMVLETAPVTAGESELLAVLPQFVGPQRQLPPMYSAVKINGVPLYKIARKHSAEGQSAEEWEKLQAQTARRPREVTVYSIDYEGSPAPDEYRLRVACSKGTYIRTLIEDVGKALGLPATMTALRRTRAGCFDEGQAHTLEEIQEAAAAGTLQSLLVPLDTVFASLPPLTVSPGVYAHLLNGCPTSHFPAADGRYRVYDQQQSFVGLARVEEKVLKVEKIFLERG